MMTAKQEILSTVDQVIAQGLFAANWDSMRGYPVPDWYIDGKFGIFIHWGPYCVPAFSNEWYPRYMYIQGRREFEHHVATYGPHNKFGYKDFIPMFKAEKFDADEWATLFRKAGARYVVPVAEHHDGFAMYDCSFNRWSSVNMGPKRDVVGELATAVRNQGLVFGLSSHRAEHWWFMNGGRDFDSDVNDPAYEDFYGPAVKMEGEYRDAGKLDAKPFPDAAYLDDWLARCCELVDKYQPQLFWFDWWIGHKAFESYLPRFTAYYYNRAAQWGKQVAINYKLEAMPNDVAVLDIERGQLSDLTPFFWQTDTCVSYNSWCYITDHKYRTADTIIHDLADIVSKNGSLLLNIGPRPDGTIPEEEQSLLLAVGRWLETNGEAIYNTRPWRVYGEGPTRIEGGGFTEGKREAFTATDIRYTQKDKTLYAILLGWPDNGEAVLYSLSGNLTLLPETIERITMLGAEGNLTWNRSADALRVQLPAQKPGEWAYTLKIELKA